MTYNPLFAHLKKLDWFLIGSVLIMILFSCLSLHSYSVREGNFLIFQKQIVFFFIGFVIMLGMSFIDWRIFKSHPYLLLILYLICLALLAGLLVIGKTTRGIQGWYHLGPISFNPIELTKVVLILLLAKYFSLRNTEMYNFRHVLISGIYVLLPCILIFMQPDFGSILIILLIWIGMLFVSGIKMRHFLILCLVGALAFALLWGVLKDYQRQRIMTFVNPQVDNLAAGWNQQQTKIAIGSGGWTGKGFGNGTQVKLSFLPEPHTDFIFSAIAEEAGFLGVIVLIGAILVFTWRVILIAMAAPDNFSRLFATGLAIALFVQSFINIAMNLNLFPIVGLPLPLVSYGGGSLIFTFLALGILQSIRLNEAI